MRTILIILFCGLSSISYSQLLLGIHCGVNIANTSYTGVFQDLKTSTKSDLFFGITTGIKLGGKLSVLGDVQYSRKGHAEEFADGDGLFRYHYLEVIPQLEYRLVGPLALAVGFNYVLLLAEQSKPSGSPAIKLKDTIKPTDFGLVVTAKVYLSKLFGFVRYNSGISDISDLEFKGQSVDRIKVDYSQFNRNWQVGVGYMLF